MTGLGCGKSKEDRIQWLKKQQQNDKQCSTKHYTKNRGTGTH